MVNVDDLGIIKANKTSYANSLWGMMVSPSSRYALQSFDNDVIEQWRGSPTFNMALINVTILDTKTIIIFVLCRLQEFPWKSTIKLA